MSDKLHAMGKHIFGTLSRRLLQHPELPASPRPPPVNQNFIFITRLFTIMRLRGGGDRASAERDLNRKHLQPVRFVPVFGLELRLPARPGLRTAPNEDLALL